MGSRAEARAQRERAVLEASRARTPAGKPDPASPPHGAWYRDDGMAREAGASTRSVGMAIFFAILSGVFAMLAGLIVWMIWGDVLRGFGVLPPAPGRPSSVGFACLLLLANLPVAALMGGLVLSAVVMAAGSVRVRLDRGVVELARGVGAVSWRRRFEQQAIESVQESIKIVYGKYGPVAVKEMQLNLRTGKPVRFGGYLSEPRLWWVRGMTARMLGVPDVTGAEAAVPTSAPVHAAAPARGPAGV